MTCVPVPMDQLYVILGFLWVVVSIALQYRAYDRGFRVGLNLQGDMKDG